MKDLNYWKNRKIKKPIIVKSKRVQSIREFMKEKRRVVSLPVQVKLRRKDGTLVKIPATEGTYVLKYSDVLKILRMRKELIRKRIRFTDAYRMAEILNEDIEEWLK